jgi:predicted ATPase
VSEEREAYSVVNMGAGFGQLIWIASLLELQARRGKRGDISPLVGIEEPELHLHPGIQPKMADLLTTYVRAGVHMLCTTQSEHLLIALLQAVARAEIDHTDLAVYYVQNGVVQSLEVDELGRLSGGLKGFFDADEAELIERLQTLMTSQEKGS